MRVLFVFISVLLISGCVNVRGSENLAQSGALSSERRAEQATALDVHALLGQPHTVIEGEEGERIWAYYRVRDRMKLTSFLPYIGYPIGGFDVEWTVASVAIGDDDRVLEVRTMSDEKYKNNILFTGDLFTRSRQVRSVREEMEGLDLPFDDKLARQMAAVVDRYVE